MNTAHRRILVALGASLLLFAGWWLWRGDDETRIRRMFDRMGAVATKLPNEQPAVAFGKARELAAFFHADAEAADAESGTVVKGREELTQHVFYARETSSAAEVEVEVQDLAVTDGTRASARVVVRVRPPEGETSEYDGTEVALTLEKGDDGWLVRKAFVERPKTSP